MLRTMTSCHKTNDGYDATIMNYLYLLDVYSVPSSLPAVSVCLEGAMPELNVLLKSSYEIYTYMCLK